MNKQNTQKPQPPVGKVIRESVGVFCKQCKSTMSKTGLFGLFGKRVCDNPNCRSEGIPVNPMDVNEKLRETLKEIGDKYIDQEDSEQLREKLRAEILKMWELNHEKELKQFILQCLNDPGLAPLLPITLIEENAGEPIDGITIEESYTYSKDMCF